jgi:hypothetical protein
MRRLFPWLLLLVMAAVFTGCASQDEDNLSARPWNEQRTWETGLPSGMTEGR